jgi:hypothetical protein
MKARIIFSTCAKETFIALQTKAQRHQKESSILKAIEEKIGSS